jgi:UDP-N-acetylmuramate--alanine ligase
MNKNVLTSLSDIENIYFVGAGGIGMANLVRFFLAKGKCVAGYDRVKSALSSSLEAEGAEICYTDDHTLIPQPFRDPAATLVVYTPAVPDTNDIISWFRASGFNVVKRAAVLGAITRDSDGICVAGSHGKTTTSSMIANIMRLSSVGCNAFLGGILRNINSNLVLSDSSPYSVIEADEYDRSFHQLSPKIAIITSTDPDHLDIYGNEANYLESFAHFTSLIKPGGTLLLHTGLKLQARPGAEVATFTYSGKEKGDFHAYDIRFSEGRLFFSIHGPEGWDLKDVEPGLPIEINIDNAVAAAAAAHIAGVDDAAIHEGLATFMGAKRRFEFYLRPGEGRAILLDDYAHSPNEVRASINSVRKLFPGKHLTVIFQPHLYTRTRDFAAEFGAALAGADRVWLPEIYPARELPIEGVTSEIILNAIPESQSSDGKSDSAQKKSPEKRLCERKDLLKLIKNTNFEVLMTLGAADIDRLLPDIVEILRDEQ